MFACKFTEPNEHSHLSRMDSHFSEMSALHGGELTLFTIDCAVCSGSSHEYKDSDSLAFHMSILARSVAMYGVAGAKDSAVGRATGPDRLTRTSVF